MAKKKLKTGPMELQYEVKQMKTKFGSRKIVLVPDKKVGGYTSITFAGESPIVAEGESKREAIKNLRMAYETVASSEPQ